MISAIRAHKIREATYLCLTESAAPLRLSLNNADAQRERERGVRVLGKQDLALMQQYRRVSETKLGLDVCLKGKKLLKGSAKLLSWQHCASPFLQLWARPRIKQKIHAALIQLVLLAQICVNALLAQIYNKIDKSPKQN